MNNVSPRHPKYPAPQKIISPATVGAFAKDNNETRLQAIPKQSRVAVRAKRRLSDTALQSPTHVAQSSRATTPSTDRKGEQTGARRREGAAGGLAGDLDRVLSGGEDARV